MQNPDNQSRPNKKTIWNSFIDGLGAVAFPIWLLLSCFGSSQLHLSPTNTSLMVMAMSIVMTAQLLRGLLGFLNLPNIPTWLAISTLSSDRLWAEGLLAMLVLWFVLSVSVRGEFDFMPFFVPTAATELSLFLLLNALWIKRLLSAGESATLKYTAIFLAPIAMAGVLACSLYYLLHLSNSLDIGLLAISSLVPLLVATLRLSIKDERDRVKNTTGVIWTQVVALPLIPVSYFLLKFIWPKQINVTVILCTLLLLPIILRLLPNQRKKKPWLIKEKLQILRWKLHQQNKDGHLTTLTPEFEQELLQARQEIAALNLSKADTRDYLDKADTYRELGHLDCELQRFQEAEKNYVNAVESYDDALSLAPNSSATTNRASVLERLLAVRSHLRGENTGH